ncbi:hypothetical protein PUNSTDRAFT_27916, partial [Punctularia strigosozonata HHB-11173 SS5]|uniref:uncharacterized protein n=1 Tax=Punctularia strigosozonata (strain HHB-11173) TaxID=741275 RepID=UPI0004416B3A
VLVFGAYKRVDRKIKPVPGVYPEDAKVTRQFPRNPLTGLTKLPERPPDFTPTQKITQERMNAMDINSDHYLWPEEEKLIKHVLVKNERALAFEDYERGIFRDDYFSPYIIPVEPHVPWEHPNIPIPPGHREEVIRMLKEFIAHGVYEPSQSSYRSKWFCVAKKNGK